MAKKISQLTQATEVKSDDVTVIVQDGETKKLPLNMMVTKQDIENKKIAGLAKLDEIEATYENDTYTPTFTVKNKSSVKTGEGDEVDYSANVMDGHVKSAILKGNTLVNHINRMYEIQCEAGGYERFTIMSGKTLPAGTYILLYNVIKTGGEATTASGDRNTPYYTKVDGTKIYQGWENHNSTTGKKYWVFTSDQAIETMTYWCAYKSEEVHVKDFVLLTYQEGMENWDIPFFEGMKSVQMPVLTTTGKNLFDGELELGGLSTTTGLPNNNQVDRCRTKNYTKVKPSTTYVAYNNYSSTIGIREFDDNYNFISWSSLPSSNKFTTSNNTKYLKFIIINTNNDNLLQIEEGSTATSYEPYKTNILSTSEDVELRGIGDVRDELDLLTGELIENFESFTLNGSEDWKINSDNDENTTRFILLNYVDGKVVNQNIGITNNYEWGNINEDKPRIIITKPSGHVYLRTPKMSVDELKTMLNNNPIHGYYNKEKSIKTVDLMPSGTHPSTTPYCWKNGHIQLSSSGLLPNLEYSVVTSRAGQINQNATMIVKNDKRIFDLEILLAGGLVNTTYQALTLQNQVETGLSKVSLNSETEPDYLLYHMIMKLIEEKAYKLDDLAEKVSVFYLYEKLSDEQFETIYSALYPFAEDEIVEEPVVEELPEVVEDEVIM